MKRQLNDKLHDYNLTGIWKFYDTYGVLEKEETYLKNKKDGYFTHKENNKIVKEGLHKDNKIYQCTKYIYDKESRTPEGLIREERYCKGKKHGKWKIYRDKKGYVPYSEIINYKDGKKHGKSILKSSNESYSTNYKNGKKNGDFLRLRDLYLPSNGEIIESGFYKDDEKHGEWKLFDTKKRLQQRLWFKNGKKNGNCYIYDSPDYQISRQFPNTYEYLEEIGIVGYIQHLKNQYEIGDINYTIDFKDDKFHGIFIMNITNRMKKQGKMYEINFKNGKRHGSLSSFHYYNFRKESEQQYKNGMVHGTCYDYHNEYIKKSTYKNQELHGPYETSDKKPSGKRFIIEKGQYRNDKKDGVWKYYKDEVIQKGETWKKGKLIESKKY